MGCFGRLQVTCGSRALEGVSWLINLSLLVRDLVHGFPHLGVYLYMYSHIEYIDV